MAFARVVQRFDKAVKPTSLVEVTVGPEVIAEILTGWSRASAQIEAHDHAIALNSPSPTIDDLKDDLKLLTEFVAKHKERKKDALEKYKHLKG